MSGFSLRRFGRSRASLSVNNKNDSENSERLQRNKKSSLNLKSSPKECGKEAEAELIQVLKTIGKRHGDGDKNSSIDIKQLDSDIEKLVSIMKDNRSSKHIQRVACHAISNMAIHQEKCPTLTKHKCHELILRTVFDHIQDWKMCWLAGSAIWNLARPEPCRRQFDIKTLKLLYKVIKQHSKVHLVIETALGALSNLVLFEQLRNEAGQFEILQNIVDIIKQHKKHCNVATASAGLITNLAHSNLIASKLTDIGTVGLVIQMMKFHSHDTHLQRNCCAALSNMASSAGYVQNLVENLGIERLFAALNLASINPASQIEPLAEQALLVVDIDWTQMRLSSIHVASKLGLYEAVYKILKQGIDVNTCVDSHGNTALHYAIRYKKPEVARLLISRGALLTIKNKFGLTANRALQDMIVAKKSSLSSADGTTIGDNDHDHDDKTQTLARNITETEVISLSTDFPKEKPTVNHDDVDDIRLQQYKSLQSALSQGYDLLEKAQKSMQIDINPFMECLPQDIVGVVVDYIPAPEVMKNYGIDDSKLPESKTNKLQSCMSTYSLEHSTDPRRGGSSQEIGRIDDVDEENAQYFADEDLYPQN